MNLAWVINEMFLFQVHALVSVMASGDSGGSRNACFALSCLAASREGHGHVMRSPAFPWALDTLCHLLCAEEQESSWFAAMWVLIPCACVGTVGEAVFFPRGQ